MTQQPIPPSDLPCESFYEIDQDGDTNWCIHRECIPFQKPVGRQLMSGNALLYYPELTKKLREMADYPILKRCYPVDEKLNSFDQYLYQHTCHRAFKTELNQASLQVNQFIDTYGQQRVVPILNNEHYKEGPLVIHGIEWLIQSQFRLLNPIRCINLHQLLIVPHWVNLLSIEAIKTDTPFIAVRIRENWKHEGHVKWYSLDTRQPVSQKEILLWKMSR